MTLSPKRVAILERMLFVLTDVQATLRTGGGGDQGHATLRLHDRRCRLHTVGLRCSCWVKSFDELERCLKRMHSLGRQQSVHYEHRPGETRTISLHTAWWHTRAWYVDVEWRSQPVVRRVAAKGGRKRQVTDPNRRIRVPVRHPDAREQKALAGVVWIASQFQGEPCLAAEMVEAA